MLGRVGVQSFSPPGLFKLNSYPHESKISAAWDDMLIIFGVCIAHSVLHVCGRWCLFYQGTIVFSLRSLTLNHPYVPQESIP